MKLLVLGGYGVFGGRLARLISDMPELEVLICGRDPERAAAFCATCDGPARFRPLRLDRAAIAQALAVERPDLVVDASGPFQLYGEDCYGVVRACIAARTDYMDFADGADFVSGVSRFDADARAAGIHVLSGVSSFPVLTAAVLRRMAETMEIVSVEGGIAPSPFAGIGLNVMRAVIGYAGAPVRLRRNGVTTEAIGLAESMRYTIAVPGRLPLRNIHFSLVDVPDLQVIPPEHDTLKDIWMGAGPVPEVLHRALNLLARARSTFGLPSMVPLAGLFYRVLNLMRFGEHRGGMFVQARGIRDGQEVTQGWHLLAEGDDGPFIPSMAIEAIIRKSVAGARPEPGARPATRALELDDYERLFEGRTIYSGMRSPEPQTAPLYRKILGTAFEALPDRVRALHQPTETREWTGHARVRRGTGWGANAIARLLGFPGGADRVPVSVVLSPRQGGELWTRNFGGSNFSSIQECGTGRNDHLLIERFGPVSVALALVLAEDRLFLVPRSWSFLGIPLPRLLLPDGTSFETEVDGKFRFDVEISMPLLGLIVAYKGDLTEIEPAAPSPDGAA